MLSPAERRSLWVILTLAAVLRLAHWWAVHRLPFVASLAVDSAEYDRWALAIARGDWLGSTVFFQAPLYPYLLAVIYSTVGHSLDAVYLFQIAVAVGGCAALFAATRQMLDTRSGLCAAALAAVYGPFAFYDVQLLKESLAVSVTCALLWALAAGRRDSAMRRPWLLAGLLLGILALLRENALVAAPCLLVLAWRRTDGPAAWRRFFQRTALVIAGLVVTLLPVALRNGIVGGSYVPTTFQGGANFYIGNNPHADGTYRPIVPGKQIPELERREPIRIAEHDLGRHLEAGEVSRYWLGKALGWASAHPGDFLRLQLVKLGLFWSWYEWPDTVDYYYIRGESPIFRLPLLEYGGATLLAVLGLALAWRRRAPVLIPIVFLVVWMVATIAFFLFARYRLPAVPALLILGALPLAELVARVQEGGRAGATSVLLAIAVVLAFVAPRVVGLAPRLDLVHYNLARLAEDAGDLDTARTEYHATLAADPDNFLTWLNLGSLAARAQQWPIALTCFQRAASLAPDSDDAQSNLGGIDLVMGRTAEARAHLGRALELNPDSPQALQNAAILALRSGELARATSLNDHLLQVDPENSAAQRLRQRLRLATPP